MMMDREADPSLANHAALLEGVGFSSYESRLYVTLIKHGPQSGGTLSALAGVPRTKVYGALKRLMASKMVIQSQGRPQLFFPRPPSSALSSVLQRTRLQAYEFEEAFRSLQEAYQTSMLGSPMEAVSLWALRGRRQILDKADEMLNSAQSTIEIATDADGFIRLYKASWRTFEKCRQIGVAISVIIPKEAKGRFLPRELQRCGEVGFNFVDQFPPMLVLNVDSSKSLLATYGTDEAEDLGLLEDGAILNGLVSAIMAKRRAKVPIEVAVPHT